MKHFFQLFIIGLLICSNNINAQSPMFCSSHAKTAYGSVVSKELQNVSGTASITVKYKFADTTHINRNPLYKLPAGWTATSAVNLAGNTYYPNDSIQWTFTLSYPTQNLPFYPQPIEITLLTNQELNGDMPPVFQNITTKGMMYFTPYNTTEIWSMQDFQNLAGL